MLNKFWLLLMLLATAIPVQAAPSSPACLGGASPLLRLMGVPTYEPMPLLQDGASSARVSLELANHANRSESQDSLESIELDGETYYLDFELRYGLSDRLTVGIDVPVIRHSTGFLDNSIEQWHRFIGLPDGDRTGPPNQLDMRYSSNSQQLFNLQNPTTGIGDIRIKSFWLLRPGTNDQDVSLVLAASIELPTGNVDHLQGNGAVDVSVGLDVSGIRPFGLESLRLSTSAGITWPGRGELLEQLRKPRIVFAGADLVWHWRPRWGIAAVIRGQSAAFDSELDELGRGAVQIALVALYENPGRDLNVEFAVVEDPVTDGAPEFSLYFGVTKTY
jgi:hypothetical protein